MNFKWWNKPVKKLFLWGFILAIPAAILIFLLFGALMGILDTGKLDFLYSVKRLKISYAFVFALIGILIATLFNYFAAVLVHAKYWKGSYRQDIKSDDVTISKLLIDDRKLINKKKSWGTPAYNIYSIDGKHDKQTMEEFNKSIQHNVTKKEPGFVIRNVWDNKKQEMETAVAKGVNAVIVGDPGSGKSVSVVLPTIAHNANSAARPSMIFNDPKGELYEKSAKHLMEKGYEIKVFNLFDTTQSHSWNPLSAIFVAWQRYLNPFDLIDKSNTIFSSEPAGMIQSTCTTEKCFTHRTLACGECINQLKDDNYLNGGVNWYIPFTNVEDKKTKTNIKVYFSSMKEMERWVRQKQRALKGEAFGLISELAISLYPTVDKRSEFFTSSAKNFFEGIVQFLLALNEVDGNTINEKNFNLKSLRKFISNKTQLFETIYAHSTAIDIAKKTIEELSSIAPNELKEGQKNKLQMSKKHIEKYSLPDNDWQTRLAGYATTWKNDPQNIENWWGTFDNALTIFDNIELENILCDTTISAEDIVAKPTALFLIIPDAKPAYVPLASLFIGQIYSDLINIAGKSRNLALDRKILFILDEFGSMKRIDQFITAFSICRSRNINIMICFQKESQIVETYGKNNAESILGNCQLTYFLSSKDRADYEKYSKAFGIKTELKRSFSSRDGENTESLEKTALLSADEIEQLPKPLMSILINGNKYVTYMLHSWIAEKEYKDVYGNKIYDHEPLEEELFPYKTFTFSEEYQIDLNMFKAKNSDKGGKHTQEHLADENSNVPRNIESEFEDFEIENDFKSYTMEQKLFDVESKLEELKTSMEKDIKIRNQLNKERMNILSIMKNTETQEI